MAKKVKLVPFAELLGKELKFFGVDNHCFKLGNHVYEAVEDEDDGYRSYLGSVEIVNPESFNLIFHRRSFATVVVDQYDDGYFKGYYLRDVLDGHNWLRFGTDNSDDYYPWFVFEYQAKPV
jgi:hypothetical protein